MLCARVNPVAASRPTARLSVPSRRATVCRASSAPQKQAAPLVVVSLAAIVLTSQAQPALALTPTVGGKIDEGASMKGNNGFESKIYMEELKQRIAQRTGKAPPVSE